MTGAEMPGEIREIVKWPDSRLKTVATAVTRFDADLAVLAADMFATMYAAPGRGLAGPQIGVLERIFVMDCGWKEGTPAPHAVINPEILAAEGEETMAEGCLSVPGLTVQVTRPARVRLRWQDLSGAWQEADFGGFEAVCIQHENDHLDGILHLDRTTADALAEIAPVLDALRAPRDARAGDPA